MANLRIGDLARLGGVSVRMLRHYHEIGLLEPVTIDEASGYRSYASTQLDVLRKIVALKDLGFTLESVGEIVHGRRTADQIQRLLNARRSEIVREIEVGHARMAAIDAELEMLTRVDPKARERSTEGMGAQPIEVETKSVGSRLVAQLSAVAESWAPTDIGPVIQPLYPELIARMEHAGVAIAGPSTAWYEDTAEGRVLVHATLGVAEPPDAESAVLGFEIVELHALDQVASTIHRGTMDDCDSTYQALLTWIDANGYRALGYSREIDIQCGPNREWITELQVPIEPQEAFQ